MEYECQCINSAEYWIEFGEAEIDLRQEIFVANNESKADRTDVWSIISSWYSLRVLRIHSGFYKMESDYPLYDKMVLPV